MNHAAPPTTVFGFPISFRLSLLCCLALTACAPRVEVLQGEEHLYRGFTVGKVSFVEGDLTTPAPVQPEAAAEITSDLNQKLKAANLLLASGVPGAATVDVAVCYYHVTSLEITAGFPCGGGIPYAPPPGLVAVRGHMIVTGEGRSPTAYNIYLATGYSVSDVLNRFVEAMVGKLDSLHR